MYKFTHESKGYDGGFYSSPPCKIEMTLDSDEVNLDNLIGFFESYLRGCGFILDGRLEVVPQESLEDIANDLADREADLNQLEFEFDKFVESEASNQDPLEKQSIESTQ